MRTNEAITGSDNARIAPIERAFTRDTVDAMLKDVFVDGLAKPKAKP